MKFVFADGGRSNYFKAENVGDCAVRAIANATGKDYKEVYDGLKALNNGKSCRNGTPKKVDKKYLTDLGWVWHPCMTIGSGCTVHLNEDELPNGTLIVSVSKHLTCVKDGVLYDTYDCSRDGERCVYGYWTPPQKSSAKGKTKKATKEYAVHFVSNDGTEEHIIGHYTDIETAKASAEKHKSQGNRKVWIVEREVTEWKRVNEEHETMAQFLGRKLIGR